tara:strand:+ start:477 stop:878 length:402 start_codon:yes stop_codon:yes gene_type:complete
MILVRQIVRVEMQIQVEGLVVVEQGGDLAFRSVQVESLLRVIKAVMGSKQVMLIGLVGVVEVRDNKAQMGPLVVVEQAELGSHREFLEHKFTMQVVVVVLVAIRYMEAPFRVVWVVVERELLISPLMQTVLMV